MLSYEDKLAKLLQTCLDFCDVRDLDILLERILTQGRHLANADAGSLYICEGDQLHFAYAQNKTLSDRLPPGRKLIYTSFTMPINSKSIAGYCAESGEMVNIADVYDLPPEVPFKFGSEYDQKTNYKTTSMLAIPLKNSINQVVGVLQLINATDQNGNVISFSEDDQSFGQRLGNIAALAMEHSTLTRTLIMRMIKMAELRDPLETGTHVNRVAGYSVEIYETWAKNKGMKQAEVDRNRDILRMAAMLHDVGKVAIPDAILKKKGRLTEEEFEEIKTHTVKGAALLKEKCSEFDLAASDVAFNHHENWNGTGYPGHVDIDTGLPLEGYETETGKARGKKGEEIPIFGRIVSIADVYDALLAKRCYKDAMPIEKVLSIITEEKGKKFDPEVVDAFFECQNNLEVIRARYPQ